MFHRLAFVMSFVISATCALAQDVVPDRHLTVTRDVDFYGADLQNLFDTTLQACERACLADPRCVAFTFNTRSNSCFPKSDITDRQPYEGAISARVIATDPRVLDVAKTRAEDLSFVGQSTLAAARKQADGIGMLHPAGTWDAQALLNAARDRTAQKDYLNAMRWTGAALSLLDRSDLWTEYARLNLLIETKDRSQRRNYQSRALHGAVNAYLRALDDPQRVLALTTLADTLERNRRGRDMVRALRLAENIQPRPDILAALERAVAKYGFRITEHKAETNSANPRICAVFSEDLIKAGTDYTPYVQLPDATLVVEADSRQICIDGVEHGKRYTVSFRRGLPAASGETLIKDVDVTLYVKDRDPQVAFPGRAYVLPKSADTALPIETVNLESVDLTLRRMSDRNLLRSLQDNYFGRPLSRYQEERVSKTIAREIWTGTGQVQNRLNQTMTTRLPLGDVLSDQAPGIYTLTAKVPGANPYEDAGATQWFVLTDIGLTTLGGTDGLHVFARGLSDAQAMAGLDVTLLSRSNEVLATAVTDDEGHAVFDAGLTRGNDGAAPAMIVARRDQSDMAFLSLTDPAFDLSDRGVEGRAPAGPVDLFLTTDRGAYRAGETIHATALARDGLARAIPDLPLTAILTRPDGVEYSRHVSTDGQAGGHVFALPVGATAPRGTWSLDIKADPDAPSLASRTVLVEDFLPERIDFDLALPDGPIRAGDTVPLTIDARYLFGAPGGGLRADGSVTLRALNGVAAYPGYVFGRHDAPVSVQTGYFKGGTTDDAGQLSMPVALPTPATQDRPFEAVLTATLREGSGRPVERRLIRSLDPAGPMIGIKPEFDGVVPEGTEAAFLVQAIGRDMAPVPMRVNWTVNRIETRYQWYQQNGNWNWEPITSRTRIDTGEVTLGAQPSKIAVGVDWGRYEVIVERMDGAYVASSTAFYAGWYAPADASTTPDTLELSLDKPAYAPGDTANLRIVPRQAGMALITVMSNRVIDMQAVHVPEGATTIPLAVTDEWGAGAYVTAQVIRPMDQSAGQNPGRALGLSYAQVDPGDKELSVTIDAPDKTRPRGPLSVTVDVDGAGETPVYVTLAAVDLGILNLTNFQSPDPADHYFGQRRLGVEIRDLYGRLIDGMNGAMGQVRSGGDAGQTMQMQSPPPTEDLVAFFTGPVELGADGTAQAQFDLPDFNGTVRLMAMAWSAKSVGAAERDVIVRDPIVVTASLPRYLAPGDQSRMLIEVTHADGPAGRVGFDVSADGVTFTGDVVSGFDLGTRGKKMLHLPLIAQDSGDHTIRIALTTPDGQQLIKELILPVRRNDPKVSQTRRLSLAPGDSLVLDNTVFTGFTPTGASALVSAGPLAKLNVPRLLSALDRYPYGCTEQITSQAVPLLYFDAVAAAMGSPTGLNAAMRVDQAIARILTRQSSNGAFGLWRAGSGDFWLDAYVTDFLSRARSKGHDVPDRAFSMAMDNLRNRVNYAPDFDEGGQDIAYALMVLAREGAAQMGDLRYYADVKAEALATPLAVAQLGAALAFYGDQTRADRLFALAVRKMVTLRGDERAVWRADYGTRLRDRAGLLSLAVAAGSDVIDTATLAQSLTDTGPEMSTQEQAWVLLAAQALIDDPTAAGLTIDGAPISGPFVKRIAAAGMVPRQITNTGDAATDLTLTTIGVPDVPLDAGGYGYRITRSYFDLDGNAVDPSRVVTGTRLAVVLTVAPFERGEARLMIDDPLPAGFEIDNPNLLRQGDVRALDWLKPAPTQHTEFRSDRFLAAVDWRSEKPFSLAYIVRAVTPGEYHHPAATVEDMYRPQYRARTGTARMTVTQ